MEILTPYFHYSSKLKKRFAKSSGLAKTLSAQLGGAGSFDSGAAKASGSDGAICREHGLQGQRDVLPALGLGGKDPGVEYDGLYHPGRVCQEWG